MKLNTIIYIWLLLGFFALELITHRKNGMLDLKEIYTDWKNLKFIGFKIFAVVWFILILPTTIPASIIKIIKAKNGK